ncbi:4-hydroxythreonine-4-phosphate dehydrogenase [Novosphingobium marinum]|uniref:4-hydroxythreonine-4-phosphate dehydrogenase n=1 Tax=Novosphingobium marinum TaxID=1514948 RepID=A0A7Y9Y035_9SPHN|nr:4-hydroxythreonine-4-phosphate dehydrogenase PdxA [Novosphingobium marinum]NYH96525.1 4-hydroxythreonine-4-phosphate dehydrogenase [Novosphingobium marinum]GGC35892.1 4-hydroxythreonine-4-phosphate dehydrogenase [Novosphingobium marinum]
MAVPAPLAVSLGDPAGVGPELLAEAWTRRSRDALLPFFAVGGERILAAAAASRGIEIPVRRIASPEEARGVFGDALPVLGDEDAGYAAGRPDEDGARLALSSLTRAARLAVSGEAGGLVTGPIAKGLLAEVGFVHPGQTEFVAEACDVAPEAAVMMLAGPRLRTVPLTVHEALSSVPALLNTNHIVERARITERALRRDFGIESPRLAVAALNPHAGEGGRFGDEEARVIIPAIERLRSEGLAVTGPHPADALFAPHERENYDAALCMYHDQALIPLKALDFDEGVNVTLGLPIVRTSPDHGTAFGIAGKGIANPGATIAAIRLAGQCAMRRAAP